jgi:8-oxo-dGTP pyrophosphatase MutT (NUDIX family)
LDVTRGRKPPWMYRQSGVIAHFPNEERTGVFLVTSRKRKRWIIPKGVVERGMTPWESAAMEAYEEAGVRGDVGTTPVGSYQYEKWGGVCTVEVYVLAVREVLDDWPEASQRERRWFTFEEAAEAVREDPLSQLLTEAEARVGACRPS